MEKGIEDRETHESPVYVRTSTAAAITMGILPGRFLREAKLYCINLLLTYKEGCAAKCAYCGLSRNRETDEPWSKHSFIRVDWPSVSLDEVVSRIKGGVCPHVERVCVSMITNGRARDDTITIVKKLCEVIDRVSVLVTPISMDRGWLYELKEAGADMVGVAVDAATPELFEKLRGRGTGGPHRWDKYWMTVREALEVFGKKNVGIHLIVGLGEKEREMIGTIQRAHDMGAQTRLFSFFPEENSPMQNHPQPPIGQYRRIQLARYLIDHEVTSAGEMKFEAEGRLRDYGIAEEALDEILDGGLPFMTSGCSGGNRENACNRPYANCTPYQAYMGELRNYPFQPSERDIKTIRMQILDYQEVGSQLPL